MVEDKKELQLAILQINVLGRTLSTGRTTRELHNYLLNENYQSYIACPTNEDSDDVFTFTRLRNIRFDILQSLISGVEGTHSVLETKKLIKYIKKIKPSIVHLRVLHCNSINFKILFSYLAISDIPTVITLHDFWFMTGQCCFYTATGCDKWKTGCGKCPALKLSGRKPLFDRTAYMWQMKCKYLGKIPRLAVVGVSDWVVNEANQSYLRSAKILKRIYNWIDLNSFYPRDSTQLKEELKLQNYYLILGVASSWTLHNRKGFDAYLDLSKILPLNFKIILIGTMNYKETLPRNIISLPATNNVDLLALYYSSADVYLNLSAEETFGKVSAEALACGTPIVAYDSTVNSEIIPEQGGKVIKSLKPETILKAITEVLALPKESTTEICIQFAKENFDKDKNIKQYLDLYNELLSNEL